MADRASNSTAGGPVVEGHVLKQLVQTLRGDLNLLSNEARKKYPAVREVWGMGRHGSVGAGLVVSENSLSLLSWCFLFELH